MKQHNRHTDSAPQLIYQYRRSKYALIAEEALQLVLLTVSQPDRQNHDR